MLFIACNCMCLADIFLVQEEESLRVNVLVDPLLSRNHHGYAKHSIERLVSPIMCIVLVRAVLHGCLLRNMRRRECALALSSVRPSVRPSAPFVVYLSLPVVVLSVARPSVPPSALLRHFYRTPLCISSHRAIHAKLRQAKPSHEIGP